MNTLVVFDGNFMAHRARHATGRLRNGISYGMIKSMDATMRTLESDKQIWVFDGGLKTERLELLPEYKGTRGKMDEFMISQLNWSQPALGHLAPLIRIEGYEADDIISVIANNAIESPECDRCVIVSSDKDFLQLCSEKIQVFNPITKVLHTEESTKESISNLSMEHYVFIKSMVGDASDNIDGIKGIGWGTAVKIAGLVGSVDNLKNIELKGRMSVANKEESIAKIRRNIALITLPKGLHELPQQLGKSIMDDIEKHEKDFDAFQMWLESSSMNSILKKVDEWREKYG